MNHISPERARRLIGKVVTANDGEHVVELIELFAGVSSDEDIAAQEVMKYLYMHTDHFQAAFGQYMEGINKVSIDESSAREA